MCGAPVAVLCRDAVHPEVRRLEDVVVDRDQPVEVQVLVHHVASRLLIQLSDHHVLDLLEFTDPVGPRSRPRPLCL